MTNVATNYFIAVDQQLMLIKCIEEIKEWMLDNHTYPELLEWVLKYLL